MDWRSVRFDWNKARAFLVTAEEGSFSAAARALGMAQPTIGRQVAGLEEELGVMVFERVGNSLVLTTAGLELIEHAREMGNAANRISLTSTGQSTSIEGLVTITASEVSCVYLLPGILTILRREHPGIEIELVPANDVRDLQRREADIAIRHVAPKQLDLIGRKLPPREGYLYATPDYIASLELTKTENGFDLGEAEIISFSPAEQMKQGLTAFGLDVSACKFPLVSSNQLVQWEMCKHGLGIGVMMSEMGDDEPLVERVVDFPIPIAMWLVCHRELQTSRRIRLVFDLMAEELSKAG